MARRRVVLGAALGAGAMAALAACGGGGDSAAPAGDGQTSGDTGAGTSPSAAAGEVLVATAEVPVGGGVVLDRQKVVVTQPAEGSFKAFTAICTHQGCTVASVEDGTISCPCHGSAFSAADGSVQNGPAQRPLREIPVTVEGTDVVRA